MATKKKTISRRDHTEWNNLCAWIELNIFEYDQNQKLQSKACFVLEGLRKGQNTANNLIETNGEYPMEVILLTFKACKFDILNAIRGKEFSTEEQKMRYVCAIVRSKLNDIYTRYLNAQKSKEKIEHVDTNILEHQGAEYQNTIKDKENKKFEGLW